MSSSIQRRSRVLTTANSLQRGSTVTRAALRFSPNLTPCGRTRREFLWEVGGGFAGLALIDLLSRDGFFANQASAADAGYLLSPRKPHFAAKAKHAVFLFMNGAPSHVDTFDYKPALSKFNNTQSKGDAA